MGVFSSSAAKPMLSKASENILKEVKQYPVVIYSKDSCGWCDIAKKELNDKGITFEEKNLVEIAKTHADGGQEYVQGLMDLTKQRTVPQIFICGRFIGGYTEMHAQGENLYKMIEQCSNDGKNWTQKSPRPSSKM